MSPFLIILLVFITLVTAALIYLAIYGRNVRRGGRVGKAVKEQALERLNSERANLNELLATLTPAQMEHDNVIGEWMIKDVLAHLYHWEGMLLSWIAAVRAGETPAVPAEGLTWSDLDELNERIFREHFNESMLTVQERFESTHEELIRVVEGMTEEELSTPGAYPWTKRTSLGGWLGAFATHDRWAADGIKKWLKAEEKKRAREALE